MWSLLLRVAVGASMAFVTMSGAAKEASADIGPIEPARRICMGQAAGAPCEIDGRAGTCQGPHPSRMYCTPMTEPAKPSPARKPAPAPAPEVTPPAPAPEVTPPAPAPEAPPPAPAPAPVNPEPKPAHKGSCSAAAPGGALLSLLVVGGLLVRGPRRRRGAARAR